MIIEPSNTYPDLEIGDEFDCDDELEIKVGWHDEGFTYLAPHEVDRMYHHLGELLRKRSYTRG